ncbi:MAG: hypothetical protein PHH26_08575 [Candidatus Thermoplasmatota archaeon]|nr:hypothetical protein [Candidatus Thermoplasmatota archaeon]
MKQIHLLAGVLAFVVVFSLVFVLVVKDSINPEVAEYIYEDPSYISIREVDVKPLTITNAKAELNITAYLNHYGGKTRGAYILTRAIATETGLLMSEVSAQMPETGGTKTVSISHILSVDRNSNYEMRILVFDRGAIADSGSVMIYGLSAITPESKISGIDLKKVDFTATGFSEGKAQIKAEIYLENVDSGISQSFTMVVKAREYYSGLIADDASIETGEIERDETVVKSVELLVPQDYNYILGIELWNGKVLMDTWEKAMPLSPTRVLPNGTIETKTGLDVSKFVREGGGEPVYPDPGSKDSRSAPAVPGFEAAGAAAAVAVAVLIGRKRK